MKKILFSLVIGVLLVGCNMNGDNLTQTGVSNKKSPYIGLSREKLTQCMGTPTRYLNTSAKDYFSYIFQSRCDAIFVVDNQTNKIIDVKYNMPHMISSYGYQVKEKQCPIKQRACLLG